MVQSSREELVGYYFQEVQTYIPEIQKGLSLLRNQGMELPVISELYRLFHNIKGAASQVYLQFLSGAAELAEFMLGQNLDEGEGLSPVMLAYLEDTVDSICRYCSQDKRDTLAEADLLRARLLAFKGLYADRNNPAGNSLYEKTALLLGGIEDKPAGPAAEDGRALQLEKSDQASLGDAIRQAEQLIDTLLVQEAGGREGYVPVVGAVRRAVAEIADCAADLKMPAEASFLRDLADLVRKAGETGLAPHQDRPVMLGYFMSLICGQIEGMLLRALERVAVSDTAEEISRYELVAAAQNFITAYMRLISHPRAVDGQSAARMAERLERFEAFFLAEAAVAPDSSADQFPVGGPAAPGSSEAWPEEADALLLDEFFPEEGESSEEAGLHEIFQEECGEHLVVISRSLRNLQELVVQSGVQTPETREELAAMRRAVHTLKGAAAMVGYEQLASCARTLEDMLDGLYDGDDHIGPDDLQIMDQAIDLIEGIAQQPSADFGNRVSSLLQAIADYLQPSKGLPPAATGGSETLDLPEGGALYLGAASLREVIRRLQHLVDTLLAQEMGGREGYGQIVAEVQGVAAELADRAAELEMSVEASFLGDLADLAGKAGAAGLAPHQDRAVMLGYFMSLVCGQIEGMLLRSLERSAVPADAADLLAGHELSAVARDFRASCLRLISHPAAIDGKSAARMAERLAHLEGFFRAEESPPPSSGQDNAVLESEQLPAVEHEGYGEEVDPFADQFLSDSPTEGEGVETWPEGGDSLHIDEFFSEEGEASEEMLLHEIFREECEDHLVVISRSLNNLEERIFEPSVLSPELREVLAAMRRAVHTLKGAAAMVGYEQLATCAHTLEDMLDGLYDHAAQIDPEDLRVMAQAIDLIEILAQQPSADQRARVTGLQQTIASYLQASHGVAPMMAEDSGTLIQADSVPAPDREQEGIAGVGEAEDEQPGAEDGSTSPLSGNIRVKIENLDEIISIEGELIVARSSMEGILLELMQSVDELNSAQGKLRKISQELESGFEVQALFGFGPETLAGQEATGRRGGGEFSEFDPIELDRYSQLNLIIRSLNELSVDVNSIHAGIASLSSELHGQIARQQLIMGAMQDKLMRTRMTPMSSMSRAFFRTVRNTASQLGKNVHLTVTGDDVYMDRFIWSKITDPIMHILRNCIDHGIESAAVRREKGKPEAASIRIEAQQLGSFVVLRIADDGAGINTVLLREKLVAAGLVKSTDILADDDLLSYLFHTGFSTKDEISQISGRGVGLDVVQRNIQELRGTVRIETQVGSGTLFELRIPITLSVNRAILIASDDRQYAVPLQDVVEIRSVMVSEMAEGGSLLPWQGGMLPVKDLAAILQLRAPGPAALAEGGSCLSLIVPGRKGHVAVLIDAVKEQREIVVKNLGSHLGHVKGVSGVTILGDGSLTPVLNLGELVDESLSAPSGPERPHESFGRERPLQILIVDDSISVRQSIARLIRHHSWRSELAVDGVDGLEKLENFHPDAIILDIEMPRMNGYEFMSILRNTEKFRSIPVIMLTSRTSDKHRAKADELGVDFYMTKPFQDEAFVQLLGGIRQYRRPH